jgi:DNA-binding PadR family transcriptional regulator
MAIKHVVLGVLAESPQHGYAIQAIIEKRFGSLLQISYGHIYEVLKAMEAGRLVAGSHAQKGKRPRRTVYSITDQGRDALRRWITQPVAIRTMRYEFYLRVLFAAAWDWDVVDEVVRGEVQRARAEADACRTGTREQADGRDIHAVVNAVVSRAEELHSRADLEALVVFERSIKALTTRESPERPRIMSGRAGKKAKRA